MLPSCVQYTGQDDSDLARAVALAQAQHLLGELAAIIGRLDGQEQDAGSKT